MKAKIYKGTSVDNQNDLKQYNKKVHKIDTSNDQSKHGIPIELHDHNNTIIYINQQRKKQVDEVSKKWRKHMEDIYKPRK